MLVLILFVTFLSFPEWDYRLIDQSLQQLQDHVGFPAARNLSCPVFTQDKIKYIVACADICNVTVRVDLPCFDFDISCLECLEEDDEGVGFVVKAPFTTNKEMRWYCSDVLEVIYIY